MQSLLTKILYFTHLFPAKLSSIQSGLAHNGPGYPEGGNGHGAARTRVSATIFLPTTLDVAPLCCPNPGSVFHVGVRIETCILTKISERPNCRRRGLSWWWMSFFNWKHWCPIARRTQNEDCLFLCSQINDRSSCKMLKHHRSITTCSSEHVTWAHPSLPAPPSLSSGVAMDIMRYLRLGDFERKAVCSAYSSGDLKERCWFLLHSGEDPMEESITIVRQESRTGRRARLSFSNPCTRRE